MIAKPFQFDGPCSGCKRRVDPSEGAVAISADSDDDEHDEWGADWLCMKCALRFAKRILKARKKCRENIVAGLVYRNEEWLPATSGSDEKEVT